MAELELASADAENNLLACLITDHLAPSIAAGQSLHRDDFAWEVNALIYDAVERVISKGQALDETVLISELNAADQLETIGGEAVIRSLTASPHDPTMITSYVNIVRDRSMRRRVMFGFEQGAQIMHTEPDGKKALELVQETLYRAFDKYLASAFSGMSGSDLRNSWNLRTGQAEFIPLPYVGMNRKIGGRERGTLSIWGGYSSDGKSTVGLECLIQSCRAGYKSALVSLEMTREQITVRLLAHVTGIDSARLQRDALSLEEQARIEAAFDDIDRWHLTIYCDPAMTVADIRNIQLREQFDYICIDYLQRFDFTDFHQVPRFAKQLKNIALSTNCAIDLLSQLTPKEIRPGGNPFTKPDNHSLYGGKATANEADNIFFIYALRAADEMGGWIRTGEGVMMCTKARQGATDWELPMRFVHNQVRWEEAV